MNLERSCYAICNSVNDGMFSSERIVTIGDSEEELIVDKGSLGVTSSGLVAVRFTVLRFNNGVANGIAQNCQDGYPSGQRNVPIDSLANLYDIKPYS